jgi:hypothetical protein
MQRVLSFEQTPGLSVPLRFFLTAPPFAIAASLLLLWQGPSALASRWSPATLALTHLLTLGFLAMCMIGALLQILPVVAGIDIPHSRRTAGVAHVLLTCGAAALATAFMQTSPLLFRLALPLLVLAFAWLFVAGLRGVWAAPHGSDMLVAIRTALVALAAAVGLGAAAAAGMAWALPLPLIQLTNLHAGWGLLGWIGLLIAGVAYQVVPMFQVTPVYPRPLAQWLAKAVLALLVLWSAAQWFAPALLLALAFLLFAGCTLYLLSQRKRPKPDATTLFWRTGLTSLIAATMLWAGAALFPDIGISPVTTGLLFIVGFACSVVSGMLYKIVPFLVWFHLQNTLAGGCAKAPNVKQILPDRMAERQFGMHLLALLLLAAATVWPEWLARPAAAAFAASSGWLWWNLASAARVHARISASAQRPS